MRWSCQSRHNKKKNGRREMTDKRYTAIVLGANRGGAADPLAQAGGVSHKAFIDIAGEPMLRRVVRSVQESGRVGRVILCIEEESRAEAERILAPLTDIEFSPARENIGTSVLAITQGHPEQLPFIITTGDNALHTAEMVRYFCDQLDDLDADGAIALTPANYVLEKYPEGNRAFHRFADGQFSSCNLYALLRPRALDAARVFASGGQFAKKPWRIVVSFGLIAFLIYKSRKARLGTFLRFLSRAVGCKTLPVLMPFAEGPIDVDRMQDWKLAQRIVGEREAA
jgi:CTP:molybdopterin cytidylyltransferase MocA